MKKGTVTILLFLTLSVGAGGVIGMANKYCNLVGTNKIKDEYPKINNGFDSVEIDINKIESDIADVDERVSTIITTPVEGVSAQEIIDARGGAASLGDRLNNFNSHMADTAKYNNQIDFIQLIQSFTSYRRLRFRKSTDTLMELTADNGNKHITYQLTKDANDDFWKIGDCFVGELEEGIIDCANYSDTTGTWVTLYPPKHFTTEIGATFTAKVKGSTIVFVHFSDSRGGIWEFVVDGDTDNKVTVSTWAATDTVDEEDIIATGLDPNVEHTVVGTFKGEDPDHTPSESPARGWCNYKVPGMSYANYTIRGYDEGITNSKAASLMYAASNKEMALETCYNGTYNWIPDHGVGTAFTAEPMKIIIDGAEIIPGDWLDFGWQWQDCDEIKIIQHLYGKISNTNVAEITVTHYLTKDGVLSYNASFTALTDIDVNVSYPCMLVTDATVLNEFVTGILNSQVSSGDDTRVYFTTEQDKIHSACVISASNKNYIAAAKVEIPLISMRIEKTSGKPEPGKDMYLWQRPVEPKLYWANTDKLDLTTGDCLAWAGKFVIAEIENIFQIIKADS